jgi:hypothetical protein
MNQNIKVDNSDINIKKFIQETVNKKNEERNRYLTLLNNQVDNLKQQEQSGIVLSNRNSGLDQQPEPEINATTIIQTVTSLVGDILYGLGDAAKQIKNNTMNSHDESGGQSGGQSNNTLNNTVNAQYNQPPPLKYKTDIIQQADIMNSMINKVNPNVPRLANANTNSLSDITIGSLVSAGLDEAAKLGVAVFKTGVVLSEDFINRMIDLVLGISGDGYITNTPWDKLSPDLNKKLLLLAAVLKEISENPATKEAVREIARSVAVSVVEILEELQPEVNKITDQVMIMFRDIAAKSTSGATSTGLSVAQAFLAEIPFVGGILDLTIAIGKGFNALMATYKIFMSRSTSLGVQSAQTIVNTEGTFNKGITRVKNAIDTASKRMNRGTPNLSDSQNTRSNETQVGGQYIQKQVRRSIINNEKRLRKTMKQFTQTLPKLRYTVKIRKSASIPTLGKKKTPRKHSDR